MSKFIEGMEIALRAKALGRTQMPSKLYLFFERYLGDVRAMPAYIEDLDVACVKIVNSHAENPSRYGLPAVMAVIILINPRSGFPIAIMDGTWITNMRTGAIGGVAVKYLARKDSRVVGMVGTGAQARTQLMALMEVMRIDEVRAFSPDLEGTRKFVDEAKKRFDLNVRAVKSGEDAVRNVDVVVTTTPVREPVVKNAWIKDGMHINAIGADAPGKEELDPLILKRAKIVVDDLEQAYHSGEINVPLKRGVITRGEIYAELGDIVAGKKVGRISDDEITVFDSTGLAIQDAVGAWMVYQEAKRKKKGKEAKLI
jgi:alanine dehydrogenase